MSGTSEGIAPNAKRLLWAGFLAILAAGIGFGIRAGFGLFLQPMSTDMGWGRETFALAMAVQNLVWGATQPFAGMLADKYGVHKIEFQHYHIPSTEPSFLNQPICWCCSGGRLSPVYSWARPAGL